MAKYINLGTPVVIDGKASLKGEVRGVQDLEQPVSYLVKFEDGRVEWVKDARVQDAKTAQLTEEGAE